MDWLADEEHVIVVDMDPTEGPLVASGVDLFGNAGGIRTDGITLFGSKPGGLGDGIASVGGGDVDLFGSKPGGVTDGITLFGGKKGIEPGLFGSKLGTVSEYTDDSCLQFGGNCGGSVEFFF